MAKRCTCDCGMFTVEKYIRGRVRGITIPDEAILSICADAEVDPSTLFGDATQKQKDLALAWFYVWMAGGPVQTSSKRDSDADWEHTEGGERMSAAALKQYLSMANDIFDKYDLPIIGEQKWGFVGLGFCNPRKKRR